MNFLGVYGVDITHLVLVCAYWPLGTNGLYLYYAIAYCLSKRANPSPWWFYIDALLLSVATHYRWMGIFWLRDVVVLSFLHYSYSKHPLNVRNASTRLRVLVWLFNLTVLIVSLTKPVHTLRHNLLMLLIDMIHGCVEGFFKMKHVSAQSIGLYCIVLIAKTQLFVGQSGLLPFMLLQLELMSYLEPSNSLGALSFKALSTTLLTSSFFL